MLTNAVAGLSAIAGGVEGVDHVTRQAQRDSLLGRCLLWAALTRPAPLGHQASVNIRRQHLGRRAGALEPCFVQRRAARAGRDAGNCTTRTARVLSVVDIVAHRAVIA